jgi:hypothetical protein
MGASFENLQLNDIDRPMYMVKTEKRKKEKNLSICFNERFETSRREKRKKLPSSYSLFTIASPTQVGTICLPYLVAVSH